ncbi:MAG: Spy/CpxP family protein refolding chaperone [bacterium]|nr:Spy/CpxP family protein refolding chaperone [bacterium]
MEKRMCPTAVSAGAILALLAMVPSFGWAIEEFPDGRIRQAPPREAVDACAGRKEGEVVRFNTPFRDNVPGVCRELRGKLIAVPEGVPPGPTGGREGMGPEGTFLLMVKVLDLTKEQEERIKDILDVELERIPPLVRQLAEYRKKLRQAVETEPFDEPTVRALATNQEKAHAEMVVSQARVESRILALLTPEQRRLARKLRSILPDLPMRPPFPPPGCGPMVP